MKECKMEQTAFQFPLLAVFTFQGWILILKDHFCQAKNILPDMSRFLKACVKCSFFSNEAAKQPTPNIILRESGESSWNYFYGLRWFDVITLERLMFHLHPFVFSTAAAAWKLKGVLLSTLLKSTRSKNTFLKIHFENKSF